MTRTGRCCYCHKRRELTRDHVLPRARGRMFDGVRNIKLCCQPCNKLRAICHHCPALATCVLLTAASEHTGVGDILRDWGLIKRRRRRTRYTAPARPAAPAPASFSRNCRA